MVINYFGNGSFRLQSGETSILLDSDNNRLKADVFIKTLYATDTVGSTVEGDGIVIASPGEYEVKEIEIEGLPVPGESTEKFGKATYVARWEGMKFVFLGHLSKPLDATAMEEFSEPDVLILPAGGGHFLEPEVAAKIAKQLEARVIIPSFCKNPSDFLKALGKKGEEVEKFVFKQKDIAADKGRPIIITPA